MFFFRLSYFFRPQRLPLIMESLAQVEVCNRDSQNSTLSSESCNSLTSTGETNESSVKECWLVVWAKNSESSTAWFLLLRALIFNILTGVNTVAFSILYVEYSIYFDVPKAVLALIESFEMGSSMLIGVLKLWSNECSGQRFIQFINSYLPHFVKGLCMSWPVERFGCPRTAFFGSMLTVAGFISAAFADSPEVLFLTQGVLPGLIFKTLIGPHCYYSMLSIKE